MPRKNKTIIVVEEEDTDRDSMRSILEGEGYSVLGAKDYWDALRTLDEYPGRADMLLTAIALPGNNGYELARTMMAGDPALKVLFVSGPTGAEVSRFYNMPIRGPHLIEKPFTREDLVTRVKRAFRARIRSHRVQRAS